MKISCHKKLALDSRKDAIVIPIYKNIPSLVGIAGREIDDELQKIISAAYFRFDDKELCSFYMELNKKLKKIYLLNLPKEPASGDVYRELGAKLAHTLSADKIGSFSLVALEDIYNEKKDYGYSTSFLEGVLFALYSFDSFKTKPQAQRLEDVEIITTQAKLKAYIDANSAEWLDTFKYVYTARDLVNTPPNVLNPAYFADFVAANCDPKLKVTIWNEEDINKEGLLLVAAVGNGSHNRPRFIKLSYIGEPKEPKNVAIVGKGVTFDSGGSNLKPSASMDTMKADMSGAAAAYAIMNLAAARELPINIHAYIPLVENIIGGNAMRPGDIIKSYSGKTVEVLNTDAEGRLILADALYMATKTSPEIIIDIATLTGAAIIALGDDCAAFFSNRKFLSKQLADISAKVGEAVWELPLFEAYADKIKSKNADLQNRSTLGRSGGTISAALFLREFVENYPWIHLDIAGPAYLERKHPVFGSNATGFGIRLLYQFIKTHYASKA
ncbi:MAG: leucyl aminopeptidase [Deferribacteraceae bacterium]|jgi:leucyl aminopeptidase|nr:leucyl aminopeptidase [Deferribacteraceae bacterium]